MHKLKGIIERSTAKSHMQAGMPLVSKEIDCGRVPKPLSFVVIVCLVDAPQRSLGLPLIRTSARVPRDTGAAVTTHKGLRRDRPFFTFVTHTMA